MMEIEVQLTETAFLHGLNFRKICNEHTKGSEGRNTEKDKFRRKLGQNSNLDLGGEHTHVIFTDKTHSNKSPVSIQYKKTSTDEDKYNLIQPLTCHHKRNEDLRPMEIKGKSDKEIVGGKQSFDIIDIITGVNRISIMYTEQYDAYFVTYQMSNRRK